MKRKRKIAKLPELSEQSFTPLHSDVLLTHAPYEQRNLLSEH